MASPASPYWAVAAETLLRRLGSSTTGLSSTDAVNRLQEHGPNQIREQARLTRLGVLLSQLRSPLLLVLVFAAVASGLTGE
jgi:P-type Mg2+ transporter